MRSIEVGSFCHAIKKQEDVGIRLYPFAVTLIRRARMRHEYEHACLTCSHWIDNQGQRRTEQRKGAASDEHHRDAEEEREVEGTSLKSACALLIWLMVLRTSSPVEGNGQQRHPLSVEGMRGVSRGEA